MIILIAIIIFLAVRFLTAHSEGIGRALGKSFWIGGSLVVAYISLVLMGYYVALGVGILAFFLYPYKKGGD